MKKSNIILIILLVGLYLIPFVAWGIFSVSSNGDYYTGFRDYIHTIKIENSNLKPEDIQINTTWVSPFPNGDIMGPAAGQASYLYYKGKKKYLPEVTSENDETIHVGIAIDAPSDEKLELHIHININEIILNDETIWRKK